MIERLQLIIPGEAIPLERPRAGRTRSYMGKRSAEYRERIRASWLAAGRPTLGTQAFALSASFHASRRTPSQLPAGYATDYLDAILVALQGLAFGDAEALVCLSGIHKRRPDDNGARTVIEAWGIGR